MKISEQDIMRETWGISVALSSHCDDFMEISVGKPAFSG